MQLDNTSNSAIGGPDSVPSTQSADPDSYPTASHSNDGIDNSPTVIETNPEIDKPVHFGIIFGLLLSVALLGGSGYFYWRTYEASLNNRSIAEKLYQKGCQPSEWANASAIASANESFGRAQAILQKVPNFPGLGYEEAQSSLAKIDRCSQQLQPIGNTINYQLGLTQQVQNLVSDVVRFSEQLDPHLGYQAYSAELQRLQNDLQTFEQSNDFAYIQSQESLLPLKRSLDALKRSHADLDSAYQVWSYCQTENVCSSKLQTSEEFLPIPSELNPKIGKILIERYKMTSQWIPTKGSGWLPVLYKNGIPINKALNTVWYFAKKDLQEAQQAINEEVASLQGNPQ